MKEGKRAGVSIDICEVRLTERIAAGPLKDWLSHFTMSNLTLAALGAQHVFFKGYQGASLVIPATQRTQESGFAGQRHVVVRPIVALPAHGHNELEVTLERSRASRPMVRIKRRSASTTEALFAGEKRPFGADVSLVGFHRLLKLTLLSYQSFNPGIG